MTLTNCKDQGLKPFVLCTNFSTGRIPLKFRHRSYHFVTGSNPTRGRCSQGASSRFAVKWQSGSVIPIRTFAGTCLSSLTDDLAVSYH